jgi:hypothetical protein
MLQIVLDLSPVSALKAAGMIVQNLETRFGGKRNEQIFGVVSFLDAFAVCCERIAHTVHA